MEKLEWRDADGWHELDLSEPCALPNSQVNLSRDRFRLALNRSVVRFADGFIVHSQYVKQRILRERNSATPIGVLVQPDGSRAYVANANANLVAVVDLESLEVVGTIPTGRQPDGLG